MAYSRAIMDEECVHVSGTTGFDYAAKTISGDVAEQAEQCFRDIQTVPTPRMKIEIEVTARK